MGSMIRSGGDGKESNEDSGGVSSGVGDCSCSPTVAKGILCGKGEKSMSIQSCPPGEDEGMGGVVRWARVGVSSPNSGPARKVNAYDDYPNCSQRAPSEESVVVD